MTDPEQMSLLNERGTSVLKDEKSYWRKWIIQLEILIYKNLKMAWNNLIFSITGVIIPALLFFLFYINVTSNNLPFNGEIEFGPFKAQKFDDLTCFPKDRKNQTIPGAPCIPILYTVNSTASLLDATLLMNQLAEQANLDKGIAMGFNDSNAMLDFVSNHTGSFGVAFIFQKIDFMQSQLSYSLAINSSMQESINAAKLKVDQAFANLVIQANNLSIGPVDVSFSREEIPWIPQYWLEKYPDGWFQYKDDSSGARGHLIVSIFAGALPFLLGCALFSSVILSLASKEKHDRVFSLMKVMGLFDSTYWISWIVLILIIATVSSYGSFLIGYFSKEILFKNINFVLFTLIGTVSFTSIASSALCFSAILKQPRWVNFFIFLVFTSTVGIGSFLATFFQGTTFSLMAYDSDICPPYALNLASLFPIFHYAKLFSSIMKGTQNYIDPELKIPVQKYYGFNEFTSEIYITCKDPDCPVAISDLTSVIYLALLTCMHFFLSWYFSQAFSSEDGSSSLSFLFFLKPSYWGFKINGTDSAIVDKDDRILQEQVTSAQEQSIRMFKVSKAYKDISAVKELTLQMNKNEIFVLLGHNGAGKSTTINMITGQTDPTFGEAFIFGYNLKESKSLIQQNIGLCPQDNVLWPELSTEDHLYIYGRLRGLDKKTLKSEIPFVLKKYSLHSVSKKMISTFSGGMKRRVSMSLRPVS
jgi:ABC-type transport system involved in cytochrome c biogenesis ATPase subunit